MADEKVTPAKKVSAPRRKLVISLLDDPNISFTEIAKRCGVSARTVAALAAEVRNDPVAKQQRVNEVQQERKAFTRAVNEKTFRQFLEDVIVKNVRPAIPLPPPATTKPPVGAHVRYPMLLFTDWHFEELVRKDGVLGLNEYDIPTACRRVHRVVHSLIAWKRDMEAAGRFHLPELTVGLNGDMLTGTLHGLERHSGAPNIVRAALACGDLLAFAIRDLCREFNRVRVIGVPGNHGRLPDSKKVPTKDPTRSWDYVAYQVAKRSLSAQTNLECHFPESYGALFEVGGHQCYMSHGNFIPNNLGVVGYGIRRFTASLASNLQAVGKPLKYAFFGHWHTSNASEFAGVEAFIGPSLIGTQEYSFLSGGAVNRPAQELYVIDEQLGHVTRERFYGDGPDYKGTYEITP